MIKKLLFVTGGVILGLNAGVIFCPDSNLKFSVHIASAALGLGILFLAIKSTTSVASEKVPHTPPVTPPQAPRAEAEIVAFLALLQEHGRLVDFLKEEIGGATDQQVGLAARVVHSGCRKVLDEYFEVQPVQHCQEGEKVTLDVGYDAAAHRLLGSVPERPPYHGKLLHPGWMVSKVKLPRVNGITEKRPWPVLAPAEVQVEAAK